MAPPSDVVDENNNIPEQNNQQLRHPNDIQIIFSRIAQTLLVSPAHCIYLIQYLNLFVRKSAGDGINSLVYQFQLQSLSEKWESSLKDEVLNQVNVFGQIVQPPEFLALLQILSRNQMVSFESCNYMVQHISTMLNEYFDTDPFQILLRLLISKIQLTCLQYEYIINYLQAHSEIQIKISRGDEYKTELERISLIDKEVLADMRLRNLNFETIRSNPRNPEEILSMLTTLADNRQIDQSLYPSIIDHLKRDREEFYNSKVLLKKNLEEARYKLTRVNRQNNPIENSSKFPRNLEKILANIRNCPSLNLDILKTTKS